MCRSIKVLFPVEPPAGEAEARAAALQFVRKISGARKPSKANEAAFARAVDEITASASRLLGELKTSRKVKPRLEVEVEAER